MKKIILLLLALTLLFTLAACGADAQPMTASEPAEASPEAGEPAAEAEAAGEGESEDDGYLIEQPDLSNAPSAIDENQQALLEQFILIDDLVQPGTAGGSLRAAVAAASLLDWAAQGELNEEAVGMVMDFVASMTPEGQEEFEAKLDAVEATVELLTGKDSKQAEDILADAGMLDSCQFPWSEEAVARYDALMAAMGRRSS